MSRLTKTQVLILTITFIMVAFSAVSVAEARWPYSDDEVEAIAQTLAGECYDDELRDKRLVAEVIVNRVSDGRFGEDVFEVVSAEGQFNGYWKQSRDVSETDIQIAEETLHDWYFGGCEALSDYLYFYAGSNRQNVFLKEHK